MNDNHQNSGNNDFFHNLSVEFLIHELKDPIAVIETGARTLLEKQDKFGSLSTKQEKTMNRILRNTRQARDMLYSLLEVGRSEAGSIACNQFKAVETTLDVLANCLEVRTPSISEQIRQQQRIDETLAYLKPQGISFSVAPDLIHMKLQQDEIKFRQIIGNLIKNALHFRRERMGIQINKRKDFLRVAVTDDGPGVEPEQCESIFERYSQANDCTLTPRQGHGLGLAGARIMARCLGGDIELTCNKTDGTIFTLSLPVTLNDK
jgi:two-component system OmpR family sensor kinase